MLVQSLPAQASIFVPLSATTIVDVKITLPEAANPFYTGMASLLSKYVFNVSGDYVKTGTGILPISGKSAPEASVLILVNNINQNPSVNVVADINGNWSSTIKINPGQNVIQVTYS